MQGTYLRIYFPFRISSDSVSTRYQVLSMLLSYYGSMLSTAEEMENEDERKANRRKSKM